MRPLQKFQRTLKCCCLAALIVLSLSGVKTEAQEKKTIGIISSTPNDWYGSEIATACDAKAKELGYSTEAVYDRHDAAQMANAFEQLIEEKVLAIVAYPVFGVPTSNLVKRAKAAKIPVVLVGKGPASDNQAVAEFIYDPKQGAQLAATVFASLMKENGNYAQLNGPPANPSAQERNVAYDEVLSQVPGLKKLGAQYSDWSVQKAAADTTTLLVRYPDLKGILCANDSMAIGAAEAVKANGQTKIIVGLDGDPNVFEYIQNKEISATVQYPFREMGALAAESAVQAIQTGKLDGPNVQTVPYTIYPPMELEATLAQTGPKPGKELDFQTVATGLKNDLNYLVGHYKNPDFKRLHENPEDFDLMKGLVVNAVNDTNIIINAKVDYSKQYVASLDVDRSSFSDFAHNARTNALITKAAIAVNQDRAKDLSVKAFYVENHHTSDVMVTACTVRLVEGKKTEFPGYDVWYNRFSMPEVNARSFNTETRTDPQPIPPGSWVIWSQMENKKSPQKPFDLGTGQTDVTIELEAVK
jgi:erythritol transport system substrate-binding protein